MSRTQSPTNGVRSPNRAQSSAGASTTASTAGASTARAAANYAASQCDQRTCAHYHAVKNPSKNFKTDDVDWNHLYEYHLRQWGEWWHLYSEKVDSANAALRAENAALRAELGKLRAQKSAPVEATKLNPADVTVDSSQHIAGICDAIIVSGTMILKCTDPVRRGQCVCPLHIGHKHLVSAAESVKTSATVPAVPYVDASNATASDAKVSDAKVPKTKTPGTNLPKTSESKTRK